MLTAGSLLPVALEAMDIAAGLMTSSRPGILTKKGDRDVASEVDVAVERAVRGFLHERTPSIAFLGEEEGSTAPTTAAPGDGLTWVLDPLDGTVNFLAGSPLCAAALALLHHEQPVLGVIDVPFLGARYWATEGGGAFVNGTPLQTALPQDLGEAIVALGDFAVGPGAAEQNRWQIDVASRLAATALRVRMLGSAAIDLAWLAEGRIGASVTLCNRSWDMAAGVVVAREAGAVVVDVDGSDYSTASHVVLAAGPLLSTRLAEIVREAHRRTCDPAPD